MTVIISPVISSKTALTARPVDESACVYFQTPSPQIISKCKYFLKKGLVYSLIVTLNSEGDGILSMEEPSTFNISSSLILPSTT